MDAWIEWARGPALRFAAALFLLGLLRQVLLTLVGVRVALGRAGDRDLPSRTIGKTTLSWLFPVKRLGHRPLFSVASMVFHLGVIVAPLFLATHLLLLERSTGIRWPALPNLAADVLTIVAVLGLGVLLVARLAQREARRLSRPSDFVILGCLLVVFLAGFLAAHPGLNPFPWSAVLLVHLLAGDLVLAMLPFTKLVHVGLLPLTHLVSEVGWHFTPDGGERVARALGKENEPI